MISAAEARSILHDNLPKPLIENIDLNDALGRRLAKDILSPEDSPRYSSSAMDGVAVMWQDVKNVQGNHEVMLSVVGESQAGIPYDGELGTLEAIRISTGAQIPAGADAVVRFEDIEEIDNSVKIKKIKFQWQDIKQAGEEFTMGNTLLHKGMKVKSREIALLASVGVDKIDVFSLPQVSLLATGSELRNYRDKDIRPFQVRNSNVPMLKAAVKEAEAGCANYDHVQDNFDLTVNSIQKALESGVDIILCSGGVSVGRHDHVKQAAEKVGFEKLFWRIKQKPGKPLFVAKKNNTLLFGLPGTPVAALMCFHIYVKPVLRALQGVEQLQEPVTCISSTDIPNPGEWTMFTQVSIEENLNSASKCTPIPRHIYRGLSSIVKADGFIVQESREHISKGELVDAFLF